MKRALELAALGKGRVNPNPMVGAIIVKYGKIIGEGYHEVCGKEHAEINAFKNSIEDAKGATMYVTLEPCSHFGKTPPCADKIIEKGIKKVVIASLDPNPLVAGKGIEKLRNAGIEVVTGILNEENRKLNEVFFKYIVRKRPFILMKSAMSLDGKIASKTGDSKWISSLESRVEVHRIRNEFKGILVGVNTVIADNPELTCRIENGRNPIRIIVDTSLRIPIESKIVQSAKKVETIVITTNESNKEKNRLLEKYGVNVIKVSKKENRVDLTEMTRVLGELGIDSVLLEGGGNLNYSALQAGIVDKIRVYIAPKIIGGINAKTPIEGEGIEKVSNSINLDKLEVISIDNDIVLEGYIKGGE